MSTFSGFFDASINMDKPQKLQPFRTSGLLIWVGGRKKIVLLQEIQKPLYFSEFWCVSRYKARRDIPIVVIDYNQVSKRSFLVITATFFFTLNRHTDRLLLNT